MIGLNEPPDPTTSAPMIGEAPSSGILGGPTAAEPAAVVEPPPEAADARRIQQFKEQCKVPAWLQDAYRAAAADRRYLHTEVFAEDDPNRASCNDLLRSIWAKLALIWPSDPEPVAKPPELVEPDWDESVVDPMTGQAIDPQSGQPLELIQAGWKQVCKQRARVARTIAICLKKFAEEANMGPLMQRGALDSLSASLCWLKVGWSEDPRRDALGRRQTRPDGLDQIMKYKQLYKEYQAGKWTEEDSRYRELWDLSQYLRKAAAQKVSKDQRWAAIVSGAPDGLVPPHLAPEPERWMGGTLDLVDLENLRLDWDRMGSLEQMAATRFTHEKIWMSREEAIRLYNLTPEEAGMLGSPSKSGQHSQSAQTAPGQENPAEIDLDAEVRGENEVAIWETRDLENGTMHWWTSGITNRFLRTETPEVMPKDGIPYVPIAFNPVSGQFMPISDVKLGRKMQDEINDGLTDDREARMARYPWYVMEKGAFSPEDQTEIEARRPHKAVELSKAGVEAAKALHRVEGSPYEPQIYQIGIASARANLERNLGVPTEALQGQSKQKFATGIQVAADNMNAQAARNASQVSAVMRAVFRIWADYMLAAMPEAQAKILAGPFAVLPDVDRESIARGMVVDVVAAGNKGARRQDLEDIGRGVDATMNLITAKAKAAQLGYDLDIGPYLKRINTALDIRLPVESMLRRLPGPPPGMMGPMPGAGQPTAGPRPAPGPSRPGLPVPQPGMDDPAAAPPANPPGAV